MPRLVRRQPLLERVKSFLNPLDFLLWLSEEIDTNDWDRWEKEWALPIGIGLNALFLIARANSRSGSRAYDDVFGEDSGGGWMSWLASFIVHLLALLSVSNAFYTFGRKRAYRLFETPIENAPSTPSARRVQVNSSPVASSPMRFLSTVLSGDSAEKRSHPNAERDVWQVGVWDPHPLAIRLFSLFSPGHVLVYWLFLPTAASDPRPSVTIVTTIFVAVLLTVQMSALSSFYTQQAKDSTLVHREVLNEYDTKYVHPRTQPLMRHVATQFSESDSYQSHRDEKYNKVEASTPTITSQGYKISPNPNYINHVDPDRLSKRSQLTPRPAFSTPRVSSSGSVNAFSSQRTPSFSPDVSSPSNIRSSAIRQPQFRPTPAKGDGGSLGIYSHANSPFRKPTSQIDRRKSIYRDAEVGQSPRRLPSSPLKRSSVPGEMNTAAAAQRWGHLGDPGSESRRETGRF